MPDSNRIEAFLTECRVNRVFPGAVYIIGSSDAILAQGNIGTLSWEAEELGERCTNMPSDMSAADPVTMDTLYDLASLTKIIVTLGLMRLFEDGLCRLDDNIAFYLPDYKHTDKADLTIRQLLKHSSGMPGGQPLYQTCANLDDIKSAVRALPLRFKPDTQVEYSSQGFMILGFIMEAMTGQSLDKVVQATVCHELGIRDLVFNPSESLHPRIAATEFCRWRNWMVKGKVHDENAAVMGGIGGHAGLFGTAPELAKVCATMLRNGATDRGQFLCPETVQLMTTNHTKHLNLARGLGWQAKDDTYSPAGDLFSDVSYGHTGFTGTSIWVDPKRDRCAVLLTNRVHPSRDNEAMPRVRAIFHNLVVSTGI